MKKMKWICLLFCTAAVLLLGGCGSGSSETDSETEAPETETLEETEDTDESETSEPQLTTLETVEKAIQEQDKKTLYDTLRYWDAAKDSTGKYSIDMISAFLEYIGDDESRLSDFIDIVEDEFYDDSKDVIYLPAVYIVVTASADNTYLSLPVFGGKTIEKAAYKGYKLGPMLPMSYTIRASNDSWSETKSQTVQVSLQELPIGDTTGMTSGQISSAKHTYYVKFQGESSYSSSSDSDDEDTENVESSAEPVADPTESAEDNTEDETEETGDSSDEED